MSLAATPSLGTDREASEKRPGAFRTIGEVAEDLDVPQHVLRFWETRFAQIRPTKRAGGRRYYRPEDVDLVKGIGRLLHGQGYTIRGVQRILKENGVRFVQAIGRGEAEAGAPPAGETEAGGPEAAAAGVGSGGADEPGTGRAALQDVLRDLYDCRTRLAALRPGAGEDA